MNNCAAALLLAAPFCRKEKAKEPLNKSFAAEQRIFSTRNAD